MASSVFSLENPWVGRPGGLQFMGVHKESEATGTTEATEHISMHIPIYIFLPKVIVNSNPVYTENLTSLYIYICLVKKNKKGKQIHIVSSIFGEQSIYFYSLSFSVIMFLQLYGFLLVLCLIIYMCSLNINNRYFIKN